MIQDVGSGIRGPGAVVQGSSITIEVGTNDTTVEVTAPGVGKITYDVPPGKTLTFPVPNVSAPTAVTIAVGRGLNRKVIIVEVISAGP